MTRAQYLFHTRFPGMAPFISSAFIEKLVEKHGINPTDEEFAVFAEDVIGALNELFGEHIRSLGK